MMVIQPVLRTSCGISGELVKDENSFQAFSELSASGICVATCKDYK
jgi:hypothetical protein